MNPDKRGYDQGVSMVDDDGPVNRHERRKLAAQMKKLNKKSFGNNPAVKKAGKEIQKAIKDAMSQVQAV